MDGWTAGQRGKHRGWAITLYILEQGWHLFLRRPTDKGISFKPNSKSTAEGVHAKGSCLLAEPISLLPNYPESLLEIRQWF